MSVPAENSAGATAIRPFTVPVTPEAEIEALRARIAGTRWPEMEPVADRRAYSSRRFRRSRATGRPSTTSDDWRRG